jgi:hypothetical protein
LGRLPGCDGNFDVYCEAYLLSKSRTASERLEKEEPPCPILRARAPSVELVLGPLRCVFGLVEVPQPEEEEELLLGSLRRVLLLLLPEKREELPHEEPELEREELLPPQEEPPEDRLELPEL